MNKKLIINIKGGYMNKKITFSILLILLITTLCLGAISAADSNGVKFKSDDGFKLNIPKNEDYTIYKVENINFKIPLSLINNTYIINSSNDYISINNFSSLSDVDIWPTDNDILSYEYGETASGSEIQDVENKMIGNHPVSILILNDERIYYFQTSDKNTVYRIEYSYYNNRFDKNVEKSIRCCFGWLLTVVDCKNSQLWRSLPEKWSIKISK